MKERNTKFTVLSAIAMVLVILGHLNFNVLTFGDIFSYYSYHVLIFVFISGYFYKTENEDRIIRYILHKLKTLMLPYFVWNVIYGLVAVMLHGAGFELGQEFNIYNLLVAPFVGGHQFMYNAVAWFVPALFLLEVCNVCARKILSFCRIRNEWIIASLYLIAGIFAIYMAIRGSVYDYYKIPGRLMLMAPVFQLGRLYKDKLERLDIIPSAIYIPVLFAINLLLVLTMGGLNYSVVWVTGFANGPIVPYITAVTGIALWLRIAGIIAALIESGGRSDSITANVIRYIGSNTYSIMMHQLMAFLCINAIFNALSKAGLCSDFDAVSYHTDIYYTYNLMGCEGFKWAYFALGIMLPLVIGWCTDRLLKRALVIFKKDKN
ncbi:MAG: acyltransferase family protein [Lachnospiraceae bacterium]|nr:acyltransferase family protein [Candidatus Colinaster scatohippi]